MLTRCCRTFTVEALHKQLADVDGIQPHRSYWVAKQVNRGTKVTSNTLVLITDKGDIPVAGTRRDEVENWLITHEFVIEH